MTEHLVERGERRGDTWLEDHRANVRQAGTCTVDFWHILCHPHAACLRLCPSLTSKASRCNMYLIEILLPLYDNSNTPFARENYQAVRAEMTQRFGGVTAFSRSPAEGFWKQPNNEVIRDDVVIFEVMTERLDHSWWELYKRDLEKRFEQDEVIIRAIEITKL